MNCYTRENLNNTHIYGSGQIDTQANTHTHNYMQNSRYIVYYSFNGVSFGSLMLKYKQQKAIITLVSDHKSHNVVTQGLT